MEYGMVAKRQSNLKFNCLKMEICEPFEVVQHTWYGRPRALLSWALERNLFLVELESIHCYSCSSSDREVCFVDCRLKKFSEILREFQENLRKFKRI